ncbi:RING-H2 finger protein ATL2-like [Macadamia integrifolia]|uniref:RING-H2 finger protein ATL2-like n=1 Tax=Macadamia integrifolia TaxID=60698 RepID=UPI001C4EE212|nr:RING-H2 finger protein ATL2-like [Macadamia integrifolia]
MASDDYDSSFYLVNDDGDDVWYHSISKLIALVALVLTVILIYFYAWSTYRRHRREAAQPSIDNGVSTQVVVHSRRPLPVGKVLHPSVIASLPTFVYKAAHHLQSSTDTVECAVCLSNLEEGDMGRLIPTCKHMLHLQCINMSLSSHSTCPICRSTIREASSIAQNNEMKLDLFSPATESA